MMALFYVVSPGESSKIIKKTIPLIFIIVVIFFIMGFKRGFIYEFFCMFKYILTIFLMKLFYDKGEEIFKLGKNVPKNQLNKYFIIFIILYLIFSVILFFFRMIAEFLVSSSSTDFSRYSNAVI